MLAGLVYGFLLCCVLRCALRCAVPCYVLSLCYRWLLKGADQLQESTSKLKDQEATSSSSSSSKQHGKASSPQYR